MTNSNPVPDAEEAAGNFNFSQEEISEAQTAEQAAMSQATINHLNNRVVVLRAAVNRLLKEKAERVDQQAEPEEDGPHLESVSDS